MSLIIVGSGICGLTVAHQLLGELPNEITILEKSRGVGGRMATRRSETAKFDHGAQFYNAKPEMRSLHERWLQARLVETGFDAEGSFRMIAPNGMTSLAKDLARGLDVRLEKKILGLELIGRKWKLIAESGETFEADTVAFTCPLPQTLEVLRKSSIAYDDDLTRVEFAKALILLMENVASPKQIAGSNGYIEVNAKDGILSIADQQRKGLSPIPAWTVIMSPEFSERFFDHDEAMTSLEIIAQLRALDPELEFGECQLKKWRYSHPINHYGELFVEVANGLFLAGDAFGGASISGAVRSALALAKHLVARAAKI